MRRFKGNNFHKGAAVLLGALLAVGPSTTAAQKPAAGGSLVVQSSGPTAGRYRPGTRVQEPYTITLKAGDRLLLLGAGGSRVLTGPGSFSSAKAAPAANPAYRQQLAGLFQQSRERRARLGGSRGFTIGQLARSEGADAGIKPENLWLVDPVAGQTWCVEKGRGWTLRLPEGFTGNALVIDNPAGKRLTLERAGAQATMEMFAPELLGEGRYALMPTGQPTYSIELKLIESSADVLELARQMFERGCDDQLQGLERIAQSG